MKLTRPFDATGSDLPWKQLRPILLTTFDLTFFQLYRIHLEAFFSEVSANVMFLLVVQLPKI